ncbi:hypothetical protein Sjap_006117 [Stephania japonica]|uniref:Uncharacterized protein n=1 Tax=Stephania japonica TaxID=461633 RepID=A0AAP0PKR4_9MAGN
MGFSSLGGKRRIKIMNWGRRVRCGGSAVSAVSVHQGESFEWCCCCSSPKTRQLFWRLKSQLKQHMRWERRAIQFSYDPESYSQNFDDGCSSDHLSFHSSSLPCSSVHA